MKNLKNKKSRISFSSIVFWSVSGIALLFAVFLYFKLDRTVGENFVFSSEIPCPQVDRVGGYSENPIEISFIQAKEEYKIYYTLDGSVPDSRSNVYNGMPIYVDENVDKDSFLYNIPTSPRWSRPVGDVYCLRILRAVCVDRKGNKGPELVESYVIDKEKRHFYNIPVFSFVFNPDDLFGYEDGIYVMGKAYEDKDNYVKKKIKFDIPWWQYPANYLQKGSNSDRPVYVDYFCLDQKKHSSFRSKMRIHGFNTRGFAQKSFRIKVNNNDTASCVSVFQTNSGDMNYVFRNGGNDWTKSLLRDAFIHETMKGTTLSPQAYEPVVCFFNGEYWGLHTLRERFDELYIQSKYGISKDSIAILELNGDVMVGSKSESTHFKNIIDFILKNDLSKEENYRIVEEQIDIQNLIEYLNVNIYFVNNDWPQNNLKYWRYSYAAKDKAFRDNKWRFVLSDMDWAMGFNITNAYEYDMFAFLKEKKGLGAVFYSLMKNRRFKQEFILSFQKLLDGSLAPSSLNSKLDLLAGQISPYIEENIGRWRFVNTKTQWEKNIDELRVFNEKRKDVVLKQLVQEFGKE